MNRTLLERARCMLSNAGIGREFAANSYHSLSLGELYLHQRLLSARRLMRYGPALLQIIRFTHFWLSKLMPMLMKVSWNLELKSVFSLSYASGVKGYGLWCTDPKSPKFIVSKDVIFDESAMLNRKKEVVDAVNRSRYQEAGGA